MSFQTKVNLAAAKMFVTNDDITEEMKAFESRTTRTGGWAADVNAFSFLLCRTRRLLHVSSEHSTRHFKSDMRL